MASCGMRTLPDEVLAMEQLHILDVSMNFISSVDPSLFFRLQELESIDFSYNNLTSFPSKSLTSARHLRELKLSHNLLTELSGTRLGFRLIRGAVLRSRVSDAR